MGLTLDETRAAISVGIEKLRAQHDALATQRTALEATNSTQNLRVIDRQLVELDAQVGRLGDTLTVLEKLTDEDWAQAGFSVSQRALNAHIENG